MKIENYMKQRMLCLVMAGGLAFCPAPRAAAREALPPAGTLDCKTFIRETFDKDPLFGSALQTYLKVKYDKISTQAMAAWTLGANVGTVHTESTSGSPLEPSEINTLTYELSLQKLFLSSGTRLSLAHGNNISNMEVTDYAEQYYGLTREASTPDVKVGIVQPLLRNAFGLADRYPVQAAELQYQAAELDVYEAWEKRIAALFNEYLAWSAAYENLVALEEIVAELQRLETQIARKVSSGVSERTDLLRTRDNVLRYQSQLAQAKHQYDSALVNIAFLRAGHATPIGDIPRIKPAAEPEIPACSFTPGGPAAEAVEQLRLVRKLRILRRQYELSRNVARNEQYPEVNLVGDLTLKGQTDDTSGGFDNVNKKDYTVLVQATYPLGGQQARGDAGKAEAGVKEMDLTIQNTEESMTYGLYQMEQTIRGLQEVESLEQKQLKNAEEKLAIDTKNYRIGRLDTFYLIDAQNALTNARLQLVQTQIQLRQMQVEYLAMSDTLLDAFPAVKQMINSN